MPARPERAVELGGDVLPTVDPALGRLVRDQATAGQPCRRHGPDRPTREPAESAFSAAAGRIWSARHRRGGGGVGRRAAGIDVEVVAEQVARVELALQRPEAFDRRGREDLAETRGVLVGLEGQVDAGEVRANPRPVAVHLTRIGAERVDLELRFAVGEGGRIRGHVGRRPTEAPQLEEMDGFLSAAVPRSLRRTRA